jgi:hypothetical protein
MLHFQTCTHFNGIYFFHCSSSGTFGMEAVARQFATNEHVMVIRNGWFSYRWTEILELGSIPKTHTVLMAVPTPSELSQHQHYTPHPIDQVVERIYQERPAVVFAPHVETSTGMLLTDDYIAQAAAAVHAVGGLFVLDCIASGTVWVDMKQLGVDVLISAPQKVRHEAFVQYIYVYTRKGQNNEFGPRSVFIILLTRAFVAFTRDGPVLLVRPLSNCPKLPRNTCLPIIRTRALA